MSAHLVAVLGRGVVGADEPVVTVDDLGFARGDGCFDSARVLTDTDGAARVVNLSEHLDRLDASAAALDIAGPTRDAWEALVAEALVAWHGSGEAVLKLVLTRGREWAPNAGPLALLSITEKPARPRGRVPRALRAVTLTSGRPSDAFKDAPWLLGGVKTMSYVGNVAAAREAKRRGADDAIFVSTDRFAMDGPTAGLIVVTDGVMRTPPTGDTGILASVTVDEILAAAAESGMPVRVELVPAGDLLTADGVWLVSSGRGPSPIVEVDGSPIRVDEELAERVAAMAGFGG
ncbi:Aminotransferase class IV [Nostocoides australiense Ben110]|uniref:Aminotransferase class IV n=1 Tax=Nostocoides australiense Ben110 TaxID=1193182 RepID=W6JWL4_9MICO|nr:aminodeoxychorismate lyase [Tetrasphaera australiensis]CCH73025.1 Aminotransferase class IV [Tetrasphaera australiensis Ben110]